MNPLQQSALAVQLSPCPRQGGTQTMVSASHAFEQQSLLAPQVLPSGPQSSHVPADVAGGAVQMSPGEQHGLVVGVEVLHAPPSATVQAGGGGGAPSQQIIRLSMLWQVSGEQHSEEAAQVIPRALHVDPQCRTPLESGTHGA